MLICRVVTALLVGLFVISNLVTWMLVKELSQDDDDDDDAELLIIVLWKTVTVLLGLSFVAACIKA